MPLGHLQVSGRDGCLGPHRRDCCVSELSPHQIARSVVTDLSQPSSEETAVAVPSMREIEDGVRVERRRREFPEEYILLRGDARLAKLEGKYLHRFEYEEDFRALYFGFKSTINLLGYNDEVLVDATFKTAPPPYRYLTTVITIDPETNLFCPTFHCLSTRQTSSDIGQALSYLSSLIERERSNWT